MIHVTLTTEEGVVLDSFSVERNRFRQGKPIPPHDFIALSKEVRADLETHYEVEDL